MWLDHDGLHLKLRKQRQLKHIIIKAIQCTYKICVLLHTMKEVPCDFIHFENVEYYNILLLTVQIG